MKINLQEIPHSGRSYICSNKTGDLNEILRDLIGNIPHKAEFTIRPLINETFELVGFIQTELPDNCSRCGLDFNLRVDEVFKELLMPQLEQPRNSKYSKANHFSDMNSEGHSVVNYQGHHFDIGEYLHEVVAISQPLTAAGPLDEKGDCTICKISVSDKNFNYDEDFDQPKNSPFSNLKNIKLN